jgi:hypothetical protein
VLGAGCGRSVRAIRTARLHGLPRFDLRPIDVVVDHGSRRDLVWRRAATHGVRPVSRLPHGVRLVTASPWSEHAPVGAPSNLNRPSVPVSTHPCPRFATLRRERSATTRAVHSPGTRSRWPGHDPSVPPVSLRRGHAATVAVPVRAHPSGEGGARNSSSSAGVPPVDPPGPEPGLVMPVAPGSPPGARHLKHRRPRDPWTLSQTRGPFRTPTHPCRRRFRFSGVELVASVPGRLRVPAIRAPFTKLQFGPPEDGQIQLGLFPLHSQLLREP